MDTALANPALDLVNSLAADGRDALDDPAWVAAALVRWELDPSGPLQPDEVARLKELRSLLARLTDAVAERQALSGEELEALNDVIGATPVRAQLVAAPAGGFLVALTPVASTWEDEAVRELAGTFAAALRRAWPPRLKRCANPDCRAAFYDATRSRTRRWCDGRACGNRVRVRRHRGRN
ncbi:MAG TPA: CGNR zinc finger domain-containing protein [Gaiellaceae bacterium]|jgi:predicted RNA-binding Zn ribbon-like protein